MSLTLSETFGRKPTHFNLDFLQLEGKQDSTPHILFPISQHHRAAFTPRHQLLRQLWCVADLSFRAHLCQVQRANNNCLHHTH